MDGPCTFSPYLHHTTFIYWYYTFIATIAVGDVRTAPPRIPKYNSANIAPQTKSVLIRYTRTLIIVSSSHKLHIQQPRAANLGWGVLRKHRFSCPLEVLQYLELLRCSRQAIHISQMWRWETLK